MRVVDTHCHLSHCPDGADATLEDARASGLAFVVDIGMGLVESEDALRRAEESGFSRACVGLHPTSLEEFRTDPDAAIAALERLLEHPRAVAVGETGLDYHWDSETPQTQRAAFTAHIALARRTGRALVIHCRDAFNDVVETLISEGAPERTVMHCFSGGVDEAKLCAANGWYCSFAGNLTYKSNQHLRDAAATLPTELLMVETDSPYLAPVPKRGKRNRPSWVTHTLECLADVRGVDPTQMAEDTTRTADLVFRLH